MKISIITINYNNLEGLKRTVESVVNQTWQEFEYIVIDGNSNDGSEAFIKSQNDNIDYWVSEPDKGIYNAMNKGIAIATGEYLLFLNSGDHFYEKSILENNIKFIIDYDLIYFNIKVISEKMEKIKSPPSRLDFSYFIYDTLPHQSTFFKATLFEKTGFFDESLKIVSDWKFILESISKFNATYLKVENILTTYYLDGVSSAPDNWPIILEEKNKVLETDYKFFIEDGRQLALHRKKNKELRKLISEFRKSTMVKILIKLGLIKKF